MRHLNQQHTTLLAEPSLHVITNLLRFVVGVALMESAVEASVLSTLDLNGQTQLGAVEIQFQAMPRQRRGEPRRAHLPELAAEEPLGCLLDEALQVGDHCFHWRAPRAAEGSLPGPLRLSDTLRLQLPVQHKLGKCSQHETFCSVNCESIPSA